MRRYQKFLTSNPSFMGLGPSDFLIMFLCVQFTIVFRWPPTFTLFFCPIAIVISKLIKKYIDVTGFILGFRRTDTISWQELKERHDERN